MSKFEQINQSLDKKPSPWEVLRDCSTTKSPLKNVSFKRKINNKRLTKVIDGIFISGFKPGSKDSFISKHRTRYNHREGMEICYIINCCPETEIENYYKDGQIRYLNLNWKDTKKYPKEIKITPVIVSKIFIFIQNALERNGIILIQSNEGTTRCILV